MQSFIIPWRCLPDVDPQPDHSKSNPNMSPDKPKPNPLGETSKNQPNTTLSAQKFNTKAVDTNNKSSQTLQTQPKTFAQALSVTTHFSLDFIFICLICVFMCLCVIIYPWV